MKYSVYIYFESLTVYDTLSFYGLCFPISHWLLSCDSLLCVNLSVAFACSFHLHTQTRYVAMCVHAQQTQSHSTVEP